MPAVKNQGFQYLEELLNEMIACADAWNKNKEFKVYSDSSTFTLSLIRDGVGGLQTTPLSEFPSCRFAFLLGLPFGQFTYPLSRYPCIYEKKFKTFCREKGWVVGDCNNPPLPVLRGMGWQQK